MIDWFLLISIGLVVAVDFVNSWYLAKGLLHIVYPLTLVVCAINISVDIYIVAENFEQLGVLLYCLPNGWAMLMSIKGMMRLKEENT